MKKVNLDEKYDKWLENNQERITEKFLEIHNFQDYLQQLWEEYQEVEGLIDKSTDIEIEEVEDG